MLYKVRSRALGLIAAKEQPKAAKEQLEAAKNSLKPLQNS